MHVLLVAFVPQLMQGSIAASRLIATRHQGHFGKDDIARARVLCTVVAGLHRVLRLALSATMLVCNAGVVSSHFGLEHSNCCQGMLTALSSSPALSQVSVQ